MTQFFVAGSQFWPATLGPWMWREYRNGAIDRDLEAAQLAGINHLDVALLWTDVQPDGARVSVTVLNRFERLLQAASDVGISVRPCLLPITIGGDRWVPEWALLPHGHAGEGVVTASGRSTRVARSPFSDLSLRAHQTAQVAEIVRLFAQHPAVSGWTLGDRLAQGDVKTEQLHDWLAAMVETCTRAGGTQQIWHGMSGRDVIRLPITDLGLEELGVGLVLADDWRPAWACDPEHAWAAFLAFLAVGLMPIPITIGGLHAPEHATLPAMEAQVESIWQTGAAGCSAESLFDYDDALRDSPPFDREPGRLRRGLLRADGSAKARAAIWAEMSTRARYERPGTILDAEYYRRDPQGAARDYYISFCDA